MITDELKPCPFCGGEVEICLSSDMPQRFQDMNLIKCKSCCVRASFIGLTDTEAIEAWNRRVEK